LPPLRLGTTQPGSRALSPFFRVLQGPRLPTHRSLLSCAGRWWAGHHDLAGIVQRLLRWSNPSRTGTRGAYRGASAFGIVSQMTARRSCSPSPIAVYRTSGICLVKFFRSSILRMLKALEAASSIHASGKRCFLFRQSLRPCNRLYGIPELIVPQDRSCAPSRRTSSEVRQLLQLHWKYHLRAVYSHLGHPGKA